MIEKFRLAKWLKRWNLSPFIKIYFTYRDVEIYTGEVAYLLFEQGSGSSFNIEIWPQISWCTLLIVVLKAKIDEIAYIYFYQGVKG